MLKEFIKLHLIMLSMYFSGIRFIFLENHTIQDAFIEFKRKPKPKVKKPEKLVKEYLEDIYKKP